MSDFVESLKVTAIKKNDEYIKKRIIDLLENIEDSSDVKIYKEDVIDRQKGIEEIFENFDFNMSIIEPKTLNSSNKNFHENIIDNCLGKVIIKHAKIIYEELLKDLPQENDEGKERLKKQVYDRVGRVAVLLDDYDENIRTIHESKKGANKNKTKEYNSNENEMIN